MPSCSAESCGAGNCGGPSIDDVCPPVCWKAEADALFLHRTAAGRHTLLSDPVSGELLDASNLAFQTEAGPRLSLMREDLSGWELELNYFSVDGWNTTADFPSMPMGVASLPIDNSSPPLTQVTDAHFRYASRLTTPK